MHEVELVELGPIESAAGRLEGLQRLLACDVLVTVVLFASGIAMLVDPDQAAIARRQLDPEIYRALVAAGSDPGTLLRSHTLGTLAAFVLLVLAAMSFNRWLLGAFALFSLFVFALAFVIAAVMLAATLYGLFSAEAGKAYKLTMSDYVLHPLLRLLWTVTAGAIAANAAMVLFHLLRRSRRELTLMRTFAAGRWLSLRRLFSVFDIPQVFAFPAKGRLLRVTGLLLALCISSVGVVIWMVAPMVTALIAMADLLNCTDDRRGNPLLCAAFAWETEFPGPLLGYVVIPAVAAMAGGFLIKAVKWATPSRPIGEGDTPILFLRSFADDQARLRPHRRGLLTLMMDVGRSPDSVDQLLVYEFANRAPVVAFARPGEKRPPFGAHRVQVAHESWRDEVERFFATAGTIVLVVDRSEGVRWEMEQCLRRPDLLAKSLFLMRKPLDFDFLMAALAHDAPDVRLEADHAVLAAYRRGDRWTLLSARRPTRITYQIAARHYFQSHAAG